MAIREIKCGKAIRPDNIPAEAPKSETQTTANMLCVLFGKIWEDEVPSTDWKDEHLVKILKKADLRACKN
ncbi:unnamed protein product [Schistosoma curassoni]|uniref:Uncharacterized protein n=1 Tax=Schistosoma curassoni TaxID=6186 RepID=A0A183JVW8_9TREM|nr:unnamed protein product [Schistosoma curassoni]